LQSNAKGATGVNIDGKLTDELASRGELLAHPTVNRDAKKVAMVPLSY
jgi:hypothetical protein